MLRVATGLLRRHRGSAMTGGSRIISRGQSASAGEPTVEVCFIDPALLLEPARLTACKEASHSGGSSIHPYVCLPLPARLVEQLGQGHFQLGDRDDPESHWFFGKQGEVFQYRYLGSLAVQSGFQAAVAAEVVQKVEQGGAPGEAGCMSWEEFTAQIDAGEGAPEPFLFAGRVLDCESAGVYKLAGAGGETEGVMLSSEFETAGAD